MSDEHNPVKSFRESTMRSAYVQCVGGASGDMILGALIDSGVSLEDLIGELARLKVGGYSLVQQKAQRGGLDGTHLKVEISEGGNRKRNFSDFIAVVEASDLADKVIERSCAVFRRLAEAESAVHGTPADETHLHELGTVDTLVDVVGSVIGLEMLGIDRLYCSPFPSGSGVVKTEHGILPVPAPATAALFAMARAPVVPPPGNATNTGEMVTPTGAAILTTLATFKQPSLNVERIGYGLGTRESPYYPNALTLWLGEETGALYNASMRLIETNLDDMTGEMLGYVQERLFELGAKDVWFTPIQMKKNRPATMLSAIVHSDLESNAINMVMRETSTLGVRVRPLERYEAERQNVDIETAYGKVSVKVKRLEGATVSVAPEYEDAKRIAAEQTLPLQEVYRAIQREAEDQLLES